MTPMLHRVRDPRAAFWGCFADRGMARSELLLWRGMPPVDVPPGDAVRDALADALFALEPGGIVLRPYDAGERGDGFAWFAGRQAMLLAATRGDFLRSFDLDGAHGWHAGQCYLLYGANAGIVPDEGAALWMGSPATRWTTGDARQPDALPDGVLLALKVGEDDTACAFADTEATLDAFGDALERAATARGIGTTRSEEAEMLPPGPVKGCRG